MVSPFLPTITLPAQQHLDGDVFPMVVDGTSAGESMTRMGAWLHGHRAQLHRDVSRHGALLFRDFPVAGIAEFDAFIRSFDYPNFQYRDSPSDVLRLSKTEHVLTTINAPADLEVFMHHELAHTPVYPSKLFFFCQSPADAAGFTPICRSDRLWDAIAEQLPAFAADCVSKGLRYTQVMPDEDNMASGQVRSWRSTFFANNRKQAEAMLTPLGYDWEWLEDGTLRATTPVLEAVRVLDDGRKVFFNQVIASYRGLNENRIDTSRMVTFGDGTALDRASVMQVCDMADDMTFDVPWQAGDVLLVDNFRVMHGRRPYKGDREVLASLVA